MRLFFVTTRETSYSVESPLTYGNLGAVDTRAHGPHPPIRMAASSRSLRPRRRPRELPVVAHASRSLLTRQVVNLHVQRIGDREQNGEGRVARSALDLLQRVLVDAGQFSDDAARQVPLLPDLADSRAGCRKLSASSLADHANNSTLDCPMSRTL